MVGFSLLLTLIVLIRPPDPHPVSIAGRVAPENGIQGSGQDWIRLTQEGMPALEGGSMTTRLKGAPLPQHPADQPVERTDANSRIAHQQLLEKARQGRVDVYFIGDSITRRWGATDYPDLLAHWNESFHGWNAANFAWGGDRIQNILWRLKNGEMGSLRPKIIVVQAGTNNLGSGAGSEVEAADISRGIKAILDTCRKKVPAAVIVLTAIFPRNDDMTLLPTINQINEELARFADGEKIRFLNINDRLADPDGRLREGMAGVDRLHLELEGYRVWAAALQPIFAEVLGPPADIDLAPPPTGNPAAARPTPRPD